MATGKLAVSAKRCGATMALTALLFVSACSSIEDFVEIVETPDDFAIHGINVARYQGEIDWDAVAADPGAHFAWIKATEGGDLLDSKFHDNWRAAADAGVPRGAYHFWYMCRGGAEQLAWFIENVPHDPGALPPVLDMEWNGHSPTCRRRPPRDELIREMRVFLDGVEAHYGKRPVIYTSVDFHEDILDGHKHDYPFWVRSVAAHPSVRYPTREWVFWQYTARGSVDGVQVEVDRNVFNGSREDWRAWLAANTGAQVRASR